MRLGARPLREQSPLGVWELLRIKMAMTSCWAAGRGPFTGALAVGVGFAGGPCLAFIAVAALVSFPFSPSSLSAPWPERLPRWASGPVRLQQGPASLRSALTVHFGPPGSSRASDAGLAEVVEVQDECLPR
eukprot:1490201-Pyramimonas_sp.AAC.1